jgi:hypothetical protein
MRLHTSRAVLANSKYKLCGNAKTTAVLNVSIMHRSGDLMRRRETNTEPDI